MFEAEGLNALYQEHRALFVRAHGIGESLKERFHDMSDPVDALLLAAISGEALLLVGPPGTGKSRLIRSFCNRLGLIRDSVLTGEAQDSDHSEDYFEYLLTQFTEPGELFGFYDLTELKEGRLKRMDTGMMQKAQVVFLDEVFNASSAILNALLTFMNERRFHDRGQSLKTGLKLLISATNHVPSEPHLAAVYDRFLLRYNVKNVSHPGVLEPELVDLLEAAWQETHAQDFGDEPDTALLADLETFRRDLSQRIADGQVRIDRSDRAFAELTAMVRELTRHDLSQMSNRRLVKMARIVLIVRMLRGAGEDAQTIAVEPGDLDAILKFSLDREDEHALKKLRDNLKAAR